VRVEIVALLLAKIPLQVKLLKHPSDLRNPRVSTHRIARRQCSGKLQTRGEFISLFPHQIEAVSAFFQGGQGRLYRKLKILVVCLRRHLLSQGFSVIRRLEAWRFGRGGLIAQWDPADAFPIEGGMSRRSAPRS